MGGGQIYEIDPHEAVVGGQICEIDPHEAVMEGQIYKIDPQEPVEGGQIYEKIRISSRDVSLKWNKQLYCRF